MAFIRFNNGSDTPVTAEQGLEVWKVLQGQIEPTEEMAAYCLKVKQVYLNWQNAPDDYIEDRKDIVFEQVISHWQRQAGISESGQYNSTGELTQPDPLDIANYQFSVKWGLIKNGMKTPLAQQYINTMNLRGNR